MVAGFEDDVPFSAGDTGMSGNHVSGITQKRAQVIAYALPCLACAHRRLGLETLLLQTRCFLLAATQEVELRATDVAVPNDLNLLDTWRMEQESTFHSNRVRGYTPHGKCRVNATLAHSHHRALYYLNTLAVAFHNTIVNLYRISYPNLGRFGLEVRLLDGFDEIGHR